MKKTMNKVLYPGTFDPITLGHLDIVQRGASIFREVVIAVARESSKNTFFSFPERLEIVKKAVSRFPNVKVAGFEGLVVDFAKARNIKIILRGLRMISDFEYEFQMALTNRKLSADIETVFLMPHPQYSYLSSKLIKEIAFLKADLKSFLPEESLRAVEEKLNEDFSG